MKQRVVHLAAAAVLFASVSPANSEAPRRPRGIYAKVNISSDIAQQQKQSPGIAAADLNSYFNNLFASLVANPAIAGLALQVHWDQVNPIAPPDSNAYDWSYLDDAFAQASQWNAQNPGQLPKTIQLIMTPGFQSPQWLLDQIPSCDGLFQSPPHPPPSTCGKATFEGFTETTDGNVLPLPWDPVYKGAWRTFLEALAARYGANPLFVSIAIGGPSAASEEMIMPNSNNTPVQKLFGGIQANDMWTQLLAFHYAGMRAYQKSDQAFIDEWNAAIDMYGEIFSGLTLVVTTGSGLPNFGGAATVPSAFTADCGRPNMDCAAETTILSHFADPTVGGANAKATQTSGMEAARAVQDLGLSGVKWLSQSTSSISDPAAQILGGAQFNTSFSASAYQSLKEGCTATFPPGPNDSPAGCYLVCTAKSCPAACIPQACLAPGITQASLSNYILLTDVPPADLISPEQSAYDVLNVFFDGTPLASVFGGQAGPAPLNYLQVYREDIQYAQANANVAATIVESGSAVAVTAQELLNTASRNLLQTSR